MADSTISGLPAASALGGTEPIPLDQGGQTRRTTAQAIADLATITGITDVPGLQAALNLKADLTSPALAGTPTAPTAAGGTNTTQLATTAFVTAAVTAGGGYTDEQVQDVVSTMIQPGTGITWSYNDTAGTLTPTVTVSGGVPTSLTLTAGLGLTGGGDLTTNRAFAVGAGTGITVNADDVALTTPVSIANGGTGTTTGTSADTTTLLAGKAPTVHTHAIADVTNLQTTLDAKALDADLDTHTARVDNPHVVTKTQVGLSNVDNTTDVGKPVSTAQAAADALKATIDDPSFTGKLTHAGSLAAPSLAADQNDYQPDSADPVLFWALTSSVPVNITGIAGGAAGRILILNNSNPISGGHTITLKHQNALSLVGSRLALTTDMALGPGQGCILLYQSTRWRICAKGGSDMQSLIVACSDETTPLTIGTGKVTFRMPYAMAVAAVRASLTTAQTSGSILTVDINDTGTSIMTTTKITIDNTEKTSTTAAAQAVLTDVVIADDAEVTVDIDQVGDGTARGLKITLIGTPP